MKTIILSLLLFANTSLAATVNDVRVLEVKQGPESIELKLQSKDSRPGSYFFVNVLKTDAEAFTKLGHALSKMALKNNYRLDLDIVSFSDSPNGSYYASDRVRFIGPPEQKIKKPNN
ncbi:MAG: hypothetical protein HUU57_05010 [Bdellovibrio sp.]|nr:hypothetical protein [Bdellovibrio sp.]